MNQVSITAIVPMYNGKGFIERSLPPLLRLLERGELVELIVVDDGSTDGSPDWAREAGAHVIEASGRGGPGAARNLAAREASGDVLWFVDADVVAREEGADSVRRAFDDPGVAAVFGSYDDSPPYKGFASQYMNLRHHFVHHRNPGEASTFWSGCGAVRREAFLAVGGFDAKRYPRPSIEDIELGFRLRAEGHRIRSDPALLGTHLKEWTLRDVVYTDIVCRALPWSRLLVAAPEAPRGLNTGPAEQAKAALAIALLLELLAALFGLLPSWPVFVLAGLAWFANRELFEVFRTRRGLLFAIAALIFHQLHFVYSAATYVVCWLDYHLIGGPRAREGESAS